MNRMEKIKTEHHSEMNNNNNNINQTRVEALKYNDSGIEKYRRVDFDEAIEDYSKAIDLDPALSVAYYNRGTVLYRLGLYDAALLDLLKAVQLEPGNPEFLEGLRDCQKFSNFSL